MILTKSEFKAEFGFKNLSSVSNLLKSKKIVETPGGLIDLNNKKNKKWADSRKKLLQKNDIKNENIQSNPAKADRQRAEENSLDLDIQHQRLKERLAKNALLDLKLAKENKEVVETEVLNRVVALIFDSLFRQLSELPSLYADDILNIVLAGGEAASRSVSDENSPFTSFTPVCAREKIITFLTDKVLTLLNSALEIAEKQAKKYYE